MVALAPAKVGAQQSVGDSTGRPAAFENATGFKPTPPPQPLTADWGGYRDDLRSAGIEIGVGHKGEVVANLSGGTSRRAVAVGQLLIGATLDAGKLAGLDGGTLRASVTRRHGPDLGQLAGLGTLQLPAEVFGTGRVWRYAELWYQQVAADQHVIVRAGRISSFEFGSFDCEFTNLALCGAPPGNVAPSYLFVFPATSWMGWLKLRNDHVHLKVGIQEDNLNNIDPGFYLSRAGARGAISHAEIGWTPVLGNGRLPGRYRVGAWHTTAKEDDLLLGLDRRPRSDPSLPALRRAGPHGFYVQGQQHLTGRATEDPVTGKITRETGLNAFFNYVRTDPRTTRIIDQVNAGLYLNAPFASRPDDQVGIGLARTQFNPRAARAEVLRGIETALRKNEYEAEAFYGLHVVPGLNVKLLGQYIVDPGGRRGARDAVVMGFRTEVDF